ncbi:MULTISPECIES: hypothetical protein [unclassified Nocardiopsis]|uniref:hypothetical protein n=1 Tax=unclassified Nocardiopsis TaxID=2649073 RepID=UPI0033C88A33
MKHTTPHLLATLALTAATLTTPTPAHATDHPGQATTYPGHTTSQYVPLTHATTHHAHQAGCAQAKTNTPGVRILFFGTQEKDNRLREPGTSAATTTPRTHTDKALEYAHHWARGYTDCTTTNTPTHLALGINNKDDGGIDGTTAGRQWATLIDQARTTTTPHVTLTAAIDAEPSWSTPTWAHDWINAYTNATNTPLYAANSADGCPTTGNGTCNNGWTLKDVHLAAGGTHPTVATIPQIYRTDAIQARQWANISHWGHTNTNDPLRFAAAMSQNTACEQRTCNNTDNTPQQAWTQLKQALDTRTTTRVTTLGPATDMRWP